MSSEEKRAPLESIADVLAAEQSKLESWRKINGRADAPWTGLALSGGGVRSATFCLGVLQALAQRNMLRQFDYMSTVSGGGFIGSALHWWLTGRHDENAAAGLQHSRIMRFWRSLTGVDQRVAASPVLDPLGSFGIGPDNFPFGTEHPDPIDRRQQETTDTERQRQVLGFLRNHANYLTPDDGINVWSGVGVVLRAVLLNLLVWISLAALACYVFAVGWLDPLAVYFLNWLPGSGSPLPAALISPGWSSATNEHIGGFNVTSLPPIFALMIWLSYLAAAVFFLSCIFYSFQTSTTRETGHMSWTHSHTAWSIAGLVVFTVAIVSVKWSWAVNAPILVAISASCAIGGFAVLAKMATILLGVQDMSHAYLLRRWFEKSVGALFQPVIILLSIGFIPVAFSLAYFNPSSPGLAGIFAISIGVASALWGHYQSLRKIAPGLASNIILPIGASLFLFGIAVLAYQVAMLLIDNRLLTASPENALPKMAVESAIWSFIVVGLLSAVFVNTNQIGLNRFYRDRLIEAFMPRSSAVQSGLVERTPLAERLRIAEAWDENSTGPYPLINTHVVLVNDPDGKCRLRGGDNYLLSPLFCGSSATGWFPTTEEASLRLTLASAMTASGAAANPNAGYIGTGITRNKLISIVMMLLNVRLGYWIVNPNPNILKRLNFVTPKHLFPGGVYALLGRGWTRNSKFLELSDGGHFDNLGVYELVRRKCDLIVVCDGEADDQTAYRALVSVQRRIEEDFGATIALTKGAGPELLVANKKMSYPGGAMMATKPFFLAKLIYSDLSEASIIYMKSTMIDQLSFKVKGYKGSKPTFPHESTADQFFDPEQFEAYRELGYRTCMLMMDDHEATKILGQEEEAM